jgi:hypothetical protein
VSRPEVFDLEEQVGAVDPQRLPVVPGAVRAQRLYFRGVEWPDPLLVLDGCELVPTILDLRDGDVSVRDTCGLDEAVPHPPDRTHDRAPAAMELGGADDEGELDDWGSKWLGSLREAAIAA